MAIEIDADPSSGPLVAALRRESDVNANLCFQCRKCAAGCPMADMMDLSPTQIVHAARLGQRDLVLDSKTIWLCISCETCTARCPQGVDVAKIMDAARITAFREGVTPAIREVATFHQLALRSIQRHGRIYELGLILGLKLHLGGLTKDMGLGMALLRKGKLKFLPSFGKSRPVKRMARRAAAIARRPLELPARQPLELPAKRAEKAQAEEGDE
jgi:heterodisulfide reductase subunit C